MFENLPAILEPWLCLLTFFLGTWIGHRLTLWNDRRKEFNKVAEPVRAFLVQSIEQSSPFGPQPSVVERDRLIQRMHWWRRKGWVRAWQRYEQACQQGLVQDQHTGAVSYPDTSAIVAAISDCLPFVRLR